MLRKLSVCVLIVLLTGCLPPRMAPEELSQAPRAQAANSAKS
ncbi:hypothetical protein [Lysobacter sp. Root690]|nr:hypothetical protein [Lysobacter sp. Root690]